MDKNAIKSFCLQYLGYLDKRQNFEGMNAYVALDIETIKRDKNKIIRFFVENFDLNNRTQITYGILCKDINGNAWNEVESLEDIDLLNQLLAIGIASDIFIDDYRVRMAVITRLMMYGNYLNPENFNLEDQVILENYLEIFKSKVLNAGYIICNDKLITSYCSPKDLELTDDDIKDLIWHWWNECGNVAYSSELANRLFALMEEDLEGLLNLITVLASTGNPPLVLNVMMVDHQEKKEINRVKETIKNSPQDEIEEFETYKKDLLKRLKAGKDQLEQRKKHL